MTPGGNNLLDARPYYDHLRVYDHFSINQDRESNPTAIRKESFN